MKTWLYTQIIYHSDKLEAIRQRQVIMDYGQDCSNLYIDSEYISPTYGPVTIWAFKLRYEV
jgi:hypothetical protein